VKQHTKDVYVIPIVIGVVLLLVGLPLSAWYTKQPVRTIVTWDGVKAILFAQVSAWTDIVLLLALILVGYLLYRVWENAVELRQESASHHATNLTLVEHMQQREKEHKAEIRALKDDSPKIHVAWNKAQSIWGLGQVGTEPCIQIGGWAHISVSNSNEDILITDAYVEGTESRGMIPVKLHPKLVRYTQLMTFVAPVIAKAGQPFKAKLILVDHRNRKYALDEHTFRFIGSQQQIDEALNAGKEEPPLTGENMNPASGKELVLESSDDFTVRIQHYQFQDIKGFNLVVDNNRLNPIHQVRIIISDPQSFDPHHDAFRSGSGFNAFATTEPNIIQPSCSGKSVWLIRKDPSNINLLAGNDFSHVMSWPENDKTEIQKWRFNLRVLPMTAARNSTEKPLPLKELNTNLILLWDRTSNEFSVEEAGK
jgi:hypothetical protein